MKTPFNVVVAGSRSFNNYRLLKDKLDKILDSKLTSHSVQIISGRARGVDKMGEKYARERNISLKLFPANWDLHGKKAGYVRNMEMARAADAVIVFWDGKSPGTSHMIATAKKLNLPLRLIRYQ